METDVRLVDGKSPAGPSGVGVYKVAAGGCRPLGRRRVAGVVGLFVALVIQAALGAGAQEPPPLRPPAVPLVTHDPYFSIWSPADKLTDADTVHWTGKPHRLTSLVRIDDKAFRLMGKEPANVPALPQTNLEVLPTRTIYTFEGEGVRLTLTFMTPALPEDLEVLARPVTYVVWTAQNADDKTHRLDLYFEVSSEICVNTPEQIVQADRLDQRNDGFSSICVGSVGQAVLQKKGDDLRIDWGRLYVAAPFAAVIIPAIVSPAKFRSQFALDDRLLFDSTIQARVAHPASESGLVFLFSDFSLHEKPRDFWLMLAYDDEYSIQYMKKNLRPYWRRNGDDAAALLKKAAADYESLKQRCEEFDAELMADLRQAGGEKYARLAALAYRQCFAAGKFVADANGQPLQFSKENHSNGCIGTSDIFYPMSPQFLLFGPTLPKTFLVPFMNYASSEHWKFPFAPHDLGTYPQANGQVYGGGERSEENQMPVEESGNVLIVMTAIAEIEGNADFAGRWWPTLEKWAVYLKARGFDPENQLCTDDFAGHLAHNVNLSAKAIVGLGAFAKLCELRGDHAKAGEYRELARAFAQRWVKEADDGDHFRLAFDKPGTWSQKYNLIWDRILGLNLFPAEVAQKEMAYYHKKQNRYGLPLDNRKDYTKLDWITWSATLTQNRTDFETLIDPVYRFLNEAPDRAPLTDWYDSKTAKKVGFTGRPVVGGVFARLLYDKAVWRKWASRDRTHASGWAPIPIPPKITPVVPAADTVAAIWRYTTTQPDDGWTTPGFDDSTWKEGKSGFGTRGTPGAIIGTEWNTADIWLRRTIDIPAAQLANIQLWLHHDEDAEVYFNGVPVFRTTGWTTSYDAFSLSAQGKSALKAGRNVVAIHCHQTGGGQYIDLGLVTVEAAP